MWRRVYCDQRREWNPALLRAADGVEEIGSIKAEIKAKERQTSSQIFNLNLIPLSGGRCNEPAWKEISLLGMWDGNTLHKSRRRKTDLL
jgi:hypothetical protein